MASPDGELLGMAVAPTPGWPERPPSLTDIGPAIAAAVADAEAMAGARHSRRVWVALSGSAARPSAGETVVRIGPQQRCVTRSDLEKAAAALAASGRLTMHRILASATLDGAETLEDPVGRMAGLLEARLLLLESDAKRREEMLHTLAAAGLEAQGFVAGALALESVLTPAEMEIGTVAVDLGAAHTSLTVYARGAPRYVSIVPIGGTHVTRDLAIVLGLPVNKAEAEKIEAAGTDLLASESVSGRVITARLREILELCRTELERAGWARRIPGGFVLSGGGASPMGLINLAENTFGAPVRLGLPQLSQVQGMVARPGYAVALGLAAAVRRHVSKVNFGSLPKEVGRWRLRSPQRSLPA